MTALRFRQRHLHQTCLDYIRTGLGDLGWINPPINFNTRAVTVMDFQPEEGGVQIEPNTVAVSMGDEPADVDEELGAGLGGLQSVDNTLFVDVYGANASIAVSIASDVKMLLKDQIIPLRDYTTLAAGLATEHAIEFDTVVIDKLVSTAVDKRHWRAVKATARLYFQEPTT